MPRHLGYAPIRFKKARRARESLVRFHHLDEGVSLKSLNRGIGRRGDAEA
jgi:hypothetical protein